LADSREKAYSLFNKIKEGYKWRSKTVHGSRLKKLSPKKSGELSDELEEILRKTYKQILLDTNLINNFNGKNREDYLDSLVFTSSD